MEENINVQEMIDCFIVARYQYRIGRPIIEDAEYDAFVKYFTEAGLLSEYINRTYDDDPVPVDLLVKYGYMEVKSGTKSEYTKFLDEDKTTSIRAVESFKQTWSWVQKWAGHRMVLSLKMDGDNVKSAVKDGKLMLSMSRGRAGEGFDFTDAMKRIFPRNIEFPGSHVLVGEAFVPPEYLEYFRETYDADIYKTSKTAASSLLHRPADHKVGDYSKMKWVVFSAEGLASSVSETYNKLAELGFSIPPFQVIESLPGTYDEFCGVMQGYMDVLEEQQMDVGYPADGLVLEIDSYNVQSELKGQYDSRQIALKFGHWSPSMYKAIIKSIVVKQRRVLSCCKVTIEPVVTDDSTTATVINVFNPSFLIDPGLKEGSEIMFERNSGAVNILVNSKKITISSAEGEGD